MTQALATVADPNYSQHSHESVLVMRDQGNLISGACLAVFGAYVISVAVKLPYLSDVGPGPGFFPLWLGIGLVLFSACLIFASLGTAFVDVKRELRSWKGAARALAAWLAMMVAIAVLGHLGFSLSFVLLTVFLIVALDRRPPLFALGVGVALAGVFYLIFVAALDVSLPKAIWGF
ncbi:MAG TPA: tripartite tricarboxylate transporter TctB family protein [Candidatus Binatia bacterium]|nr:tripartite tricarboxylate transporter TctB family protein [Candidatus Binatia bacterium]